MNGNEEVGGFDVESVEIVLMGHVRDRALNAVPVLILNVKPSERPELAHVKQIFFWPKDWGYCYAFPHDAKESGLQQYRDEFPPGTEAGGL